MTLQKVNKIYRDTSPWEAIQFKFAEPKPGDRYLGSDGRIYTSEKGEVGTGNFRLIIYKKGD